MDAPRGLNEQDADKLLRDLFRESGRLSAPEGLDARILQRIAVSPRAKVVADKPLLPSWAWSVVVLIAACGLIPGGRSSAPWSDRMPSIDHVGFLTSPWLIMGLASFAVLLAMDAWLNRRRMGQWSR